MAQSKSISKARGNNDKQKIVEVKDTKTTKENLTKDYKGSQIVQGTATTDYVKSSKGTKKRSFYKFNKRRSLRC